LIASLKRDIEQRVAQVNKNRGSESLARAVAEIDEWLFAPEEEKQSDQMIEKLVAELRGQIEKEVAVLSKATLDASSGKLATDSRRSIRFSLSIPCQRLTSSEPSWSKSW